MRRTLETMEKEFYYLCQNDSDLNIYLKYLRPLPALLSLCTDLYRHIDIQTYMVVMVVICATSIDTSYYYSNAPPTENQQLLYISKYK